MIVISLVLGLLSESSAQPAYGQTLKILKSQWPRGSTRITLSARIDITDCFNYKYSDSALGYFSFKIAQGYEDIYWLLQEIVGFLLCSQVENH